MSKKKTTAAKPVQAEQKFKMSKSLRNRLPDSERDGAEDHLWKKSAGICALCGRALGNQPELIDADHQLAESAGGKTILANLYLAHKSCNSSRQDLPLDVAKPLVRFKVFSEEKKRVTFDDVLGDYVDGPNKDFVYEEQGTRAVLKFGASEFAAEISRDPATGVRYFFAEVPVEYMRNDKEIQPRLIMYSHVRKLALDFLERPVHEPSNCRLVVTGGRTAQLLQFDGQHKTTAQILLGRKTIPTKVYVQPEIPMLQQLVLKIQQEIKKQPLTRSDTLAKLGDVMQRVLEDYKAPAGKVRTEKGLIERQPTPGTQRELKSLYFDELSRLIFFDDENRLAHLVRPGVKDPPTTDKVVIDRIIRPMIHPELLEVDMDAEGGRDNERKSIVLVLNTIADKMLPKGLSGPGGELARLRAKNFFYQGSIGWWMQDLLLPAIRWGIYRIRKPLFIEPLDPEVEDRMITIIEKLSELDVWSTEDHEIIKAMRSNTVPNVRAAIRGIDDQTLIADFK